MAVTGQGAAAKAPPPDYIQGTVTSGKSTAEAGVWVIAEAKPAGTKMRKIVVTDGKGRFVLPAAAGRRSGRCGSAATASRTREGQRPARRGPGPPRQEGEVEAGGGADLPRQLLAVAVQPAGHARRLGVQTSRAPACSATRSAASRRARSSRARPTTRAPRRPDDVPVPRSAWAATSCSTQLADWSRRIAAGETPPAPPRPKGKERNIVITQWNWGDKFTYAHDEVATDRNNPRRNANGPVWGVDLGNDFLAADRPGEEHLDADQDPDRRGLQHPVVRPAEPGGATAPSPTASRPSAARRPPSAASAATSATTTNPGEPAQPDDGREGPRVDHDPDPPESPRTCRRSARRTRRSSAHAPPPSARLLRPEDEEVPAHRHVLRHAPPAVRQEGQAVGERRLVLPRLVRPRPSTTRPTPRPTPTAQGWSRMIDRHQRRRRRRQEVAGFNYGIIPNDMDGSVWTRQLGGRPARLDRPLRPGHEQVRALHPAGTGVRLPPRRGHATRRGSSGSAWAEAATWPASTAPSARRPGATAPSAPRAGPTTRAPVRYFRTPGGAVNADFHYYVWVDKYNTLGMGKDTPILNGTESDSLLAFTRRRRSSSSSGSRTR